VEDFIKAVGDSTKLLTGADPAKRAAFKQALSLELTTDRYIELQQQRRTELLKDINLNLDGVQSVIKEMVDSLKDMKEKQKPILDAAPKLNSLIESKLFAGGSIAFPPAFDEAVRKRPQAIKAEFDELLTKTTAIVDHLEANRKIIQGHLASLATTRATPADPSIPKSIKKLQSNLEAELKELDEKLGKYKQAKDQIGKMVTEIDRVVSGKREDVYQGLFVKVHRCSAEELDGVRQRAKLVDLAQVPILASAQMGPTAKKEIEGTGQYFVHEVVNRNEKGALTKGVFIQSFDGPDSAQTGPKGERAPSCKIEVLHSPTLTDKNPAAGGRDSQPRGAAVTGEDKANFYLNMALAMITANGGKAPTKDNPVRLSGGSKEEMECLWTAFKIIGRDSKLKFGEDAIKIVSGPFEPSKVKGTFGFTKESAYKTVFEGTAALTTKLKEADEMVTQSATTKKALSDTTQNATSFKGQLQEQKSLWQKRPGGDSSALDALNAITGAIPTPDAKADLAAGLRK
jgi:CHASE3 domain sensor protein